MIRLGVTGTDTGVGKTLIARALLAAARRRGQRVAAMKPVETGVGQAQTDADWLAGASGGDPADVCPYQFREPLAPLVAARRAGRTIDLGVLDAAFARLARGRDTVVVEGAGGLLVPVASGVTFAHLFARWNLDLLVVAANRLGALNHVLLTIGAAEQSGLLVRGVVLNAAGIDRDLAQETNAETLAELRPDVLVVPWPYVPALTDRELGDLVLESGLAALLEDRVGAPTPVEHLERGT